MPSKAKKGGSQASAHVTSLVSEQAFAKLNSMFTNQLTLEGGNVGGKRFLQDFDMNEPSQQKMMVFNKTGGKKTSKPKTSSKTKAPKKMNKKGGAAELSPPQNDVQFSDLFESMMAKLSTPSSSLPPPETSASAPSSLDMSSIPASQRALSTQDITTMNPIVKQTYFPNNTMYKDGNFAFGGAKKRTKKTKK